MAVTYETVKEHVMRYHRNNAHYSMHRWEDPDHKAVVEMGADAAPHLFRLMVEFPFEATHFAYNVIPQLIEPPQHIKDRMNNEAISQVAPGFAGLDVSKMEEIYREWGREIGALV